MVVYHLHSLVGRRAAHATCQVDLYACLLALGEGEAQHTAVGKGCCLRLYIIVGEHHAVVAGRGLLRSLVVARAIAPVGIVHRARKGAQLPDGWHHQEIAQVAIPAYSAHLRKGKALDGGVLVAIPGTVVATRNGVGADLHHPERSRCPRERLPQSVTRAAGIHAC